MSLTDFQMELSFKDAITEFKQKSKIELSKVEYEIIRFAYFKGFSDSMRLRK